MQIRPWINDRLMGPLLFVINLPSPDILNYMYILTRILLAPSVADGTELNVVKSKMGQI